MKKIFNSLLVMVAFVGIFSISSCDKVCDPGYSGKDCKDEWRTKFVGTYAFADVCPSGNYTGAATVSVSSNNVVSILIGNYAGIGVGTTITGTLTEENKISITSGAGNGYTINSATGTMTNNIINWTYTITSPQSVTESCTSTWTKQ